MLSPTVHFSLLLSQLGTARSRADNRHLTQNISPCTREMKQVTCLCLPVSVTRWQVNVQIFNPALGPPVAMSREGKERNGSWQTSRPSSFYLFWPLRWGCKVGSNQHGSPQDWCTLRREPCFSSWKAMETDFRLQFSLHPWAILYFPPGTCWALCCRAKASLWIDYWLVV